MMRLGGVLILVMLAAILLAQGPPLFAPPASPNAWAAVIGVSRYQLLPEKQWLEFADADAEAFAKFLESGQGGAFLPDHVLTVTNEKATRAEILRAVGAWLLRKAKPGDSVYIFLAMHGVVEPVPPNDAYLVAHDSSLEDLLTTAISFPQFQDIVQRRLGRAARIFIIADACRAGKLAEAKPFTERMSRLKGTEILGLLASGPDEFSREGSVFGGGHGLFTYFLLRGLQGEADSDRNGFVQIAELDAYVKEQVAKAADNEQNPQPFGPESPLAVSMVTQQRADLGFSAPPPAQLARLEMIGPPRSEVSVDDVKRGVILDSGRLAVDSLSPQNHKVMLSTPAGIRVVQEIQIAGNPTEVEFNGKALWVRNTRTRGLEVPTGSNALARFRQALARNQLLEPQGQSALDLWHALPAAGVPAEPVQDARESLIAALEDEGQQVLLAYLRGEALVLGATDFERAAGFYRTAAGLSQDPAPLRARQYFCAGRAALYRGDVDEAERQLQQALGADPRAPYAHNALGLVALARGRSQPAITELEAASRYAPRWAYPHFNRAVAYTAMQQFARAEEAYLAAIRLGPAYAYLHYSLAGLYMRINQPERAEQEYRRALELDLDAAAGHNMLGNFFRSRGRDRDAETEYRRAVAFDVREMPGRVNLARLFMQQGRNREAESELREAAARVQAPLVHALLGDLYAQMKRGADAAAQYREAARLSSDPAERRTFEQKAAQNQRK